MVTQEYSELFMLDSIDRKDAYFCLWCIANARSNAMLQSRIEFSGDSAVLGCPLACALNEGELCDCIT
jgi:hypothetical protein